MTLESIHARLTELGALPPGDGAAPGVEAVEWVRALLVEAIALGLPLPYLYPTLEGTVQAEWDVEGWGISTDLGHKAKVANCFACSLSTEETDAPSIFFEPDRAAGLKEFVAFVTATPEQRRERRAAEAASAADSLRVFNEWKPLRDKATRVGMGGKP